MSVGTIALLEEFAEFSLVVAAGVVGNKFVVTICLGSCLIRIAIALASHGWSACTVILVALARHLRASHIVILVSSSSGLLTSAGVVVATTTTTSSSLHAPSLVHGGLLLIVFLLIRVHRLDVASLEIRFNLWGSTSTVEIWLLLRLLWAIKAAHLLLSVTLETLISHSTTTSASSAATTILVCTTLAWICRVCLLGTT